MAFEQYLDVLWNDLYLEDARIAGCELEYLTFRDTLEIEGIQFTVVKKAQYSFDKLNVLSLFCELFSNKFKYYYDQFPILKFDLSQESISCNLTEELKSNFTCFDFSEIIFKIYTRHSSFLDHGEFFTQNLDSEKNWKQALEFLHLIYEITYLLSKGQLLDKNTIIDEHKRIYTRRPKLDWCAFCFRRVKSIGEQRPLQSIINNRDKNFPEKKSRKSIQLLCDFHKSDKQNDSTYRSARKKAQSLSEDDRKYIDMIHSERRVFEVVNFNNQTEYKMSAEQWEITKSKWLGYLLELRPYAYISDITSWDEFTTRFHLLLGNEHEDTKVPLFIEDIYVEAKIWIELEKNHYKNDKRRKSL